jgi:hypothetical protein
LLDIVADPQRARQRQSFRWLLFRTRHRSYLTS